MRYLANALILPVAIFCSGVHAQNYHFDGALLGEAANGVDLSLFDQGLQQPGTYHLDVLLNNELVDSRDIDLRLTRDEHDSEVLEACISPAQLSLWGVKTEAIPKQARSAKKMSCVSLASIEGAKVTVDVAGQQLRLELPQAMLRTKYEGLAPETLWDDGITAFLMNYSAGASSAESKDARGSQSSSWAQLQPGFNWGAWRARSSFSWQDEGQVRRSYVYAERGLNKLKSKLYFGERTSTGEVFDGVPFTGVMLATDDAMVPASERSFAPIVSGVARTHARIEIRQNGYVVKTISVSPGRFEIQDISASSGSGDLLVTVYEADGRNQFFRVPWTTPAIALHQGYMKYSLTAGRYRPSDKRISQAPFMQATLMYGLPFNISAYGGLQEASGYDAASLGLGTMLGSWGSVSVDSTAARSQMHEGCTQQGLNWRLRYSNQMPLTNTRLSLVSTQYASAGYRTLSETLDGRQMYSSRSQRARSTLTLSQKLGSLGSLGISASRTDWRNGKGHDDGIGISWGMLIHGASISADWQQHRTFDDCQDNTLSVSINIPIGASTSASWSLSASSQGQQEQVAGLNGRALDDQMTWDVRQHYRPDAPTDQRNSSELHAGWMGAYGQAGINYGYSASGRQESADVAGAVIVHQNGVTFSQPLSDTVVLVEAPGAKGVKVEGWPGIKTDEDGYTATSGLAAYQEGTVSLDPTTVPDEAEIPQTDVRVVPTTGAVVKASFRTRTGAKALVDIHHPNGSPIAFGAQVNVQGSDGSAGITDGKGLAYLTGLPTTGTLVVRSAGQICSADYHLPAKKGPAGIYELHAVCHKSAITEKGLGKNYE